MAKRTASKNSNFERQPPVKFHVEEKGETHRAWYSIDKDDWIRVSCDFGSKSAVVHRDPQGKLMDPDGLARMLVTELIAERGQARMKSERR
jgi:hypothetical protein